MNTNRRPHTRLLLAALSCILLLAAAGLLWRRPLLLVSLYALLSWYGLRRSSCIEHHVSYFTAALLAPGIESLAVRSGAWSYPGTSGIPLWLPLGWGLVALCIQEAADARAEICDGKNASDPSEIHIGLSVVLCLGLALGAIQLWRTPEFLALLYAALAWLALRCGDRRLRRFMLIGAVLGPAGEAFAVAGGAWIYSGSSFLPIWLPLGWAVAGAFLDQICRVAAQAEQLSLPQRKISLAARS